MSNYPLGMTQRDWSHVNGPEERTVSKVCEADVAWTPLPVVQRHADAVHKVLTRAYDMADNLDGDPKFVIGEAMTKVLALVEEARSHQEEAPCNWDGDVDVVLTADAEVWTCPRCGHVAEDELPEDDNDD